MNWFAVRMLFESVHEPQPLADALFEDRIVVIRASSEDQARDKAAKLAREVEREESYRGAEGDHVTWTFRGVTVVGALYDSEIADGTEIYHQL